MDLLSIFEYLGYPVCNQIPERSLFYLGYQMPLCARCTGIYIGFVVATVYVALLHRRFEFSRRALPVALLITSLALPLIIDVATSYTGLRSTTNNIRLLTGLLFGISGGILLIGLLNDALNPSFHPIGLKDMGLALAAPPLFILVIDGINTLVGYLAFSILSVTGYVLLFYIGLRLLLHESGIGFFHGQKGCPRVVLAVLAIELLLFLSLAALRYTVLGYVK